jgi:hypothetical protein
MVAILGSDDLDDELSDESITADWILKRIQKGKRSD